MEEVCCYVEMHLLSNLGHTEKECYSKNKKKVASVIVQEDERVGEQQSESPEYTAGCVISKNNKSDVGIVHEKIKSSMVDGKLKLADGNEIDVITNTYPTASNKEKNMPVTKGYIEAQEVSVLRDSGCSWAVVKIKYVKDEELTGEEGIMVLVENTVRKAPFALITVDTPHYSGKIRVLWLPDAVYDLVIGNVSGALPSGKPDLNWQLGGMVAVTRNGTKGLRNGTDAPWKMEQKQLIYLQNSD